MAFEGAIVVIDSFNQGLIKFFRPTKNFILPNRKNTVPVNFLVRFIFSKVMNHEGLIVFKAIVRKYWIKMAYYMASGNVGDVAVAKIFRSSELLASSLILSKNSNG